MEIRRTSPTYVLLDVFVNAVRGEETLSSLVKRYLGEQERITEETNYHVIRDMEKIKVTQSSGNTCSATTIYYEEMLDLAPRVPVHP